MNVSQVFAWMVLSLTTITLCTAQTSNREIASVELTPTITDNATSLPAFNEFQLLDTAPIPLNYESVRSQIDYPEVAREAGFEGLVQMQILVNETGKPIRYRIASSPNELLSEAVFGQVEALKFDAATRSGETTAAWVTIPFRFQLQP